MGGRKQFSASDGQQRMMEMPDRESMEGNPGMKERPNMEAGEDMEDALPAMGQIEPPDGSPEEGRTFSPDAARGRGDHADFRQRDPGQTPGQMPGGMEDFSSGNPAVTLVLLGVSVAALFLGLLFAMMKKY